MRCSVQIYLPALISADDYHEITGIVNSINKLTSVPINNKEIGLQRGKYWAVLYRSHFEPDDEDMQRLYRQHGLTIENFV